MILSINDFLKPNSQASCEQILEQLEDVLMFSESAKSLQAELGDELIKHIRTNLDHYCTITNFNNDNLFVAAVKDRKYKLASLLLSLSEQFNIEILNLAEIKLFFAWAVSNGYSQIATICLSFIEEKTQVVNMLDKTSKKTLLHLASKNGNEDCVKILLDNGADVNPLDSYNNMPLDEACRYGHLNVAKLLVCNHANINAQNKRIYYTTTPLKYAVIYGKKNVVELLLDKGAEVNSCNSEDFSPLECAIMASNGTTSHDEIIVDLLLHGAIDTNLESIVDKNRAIRFSICFNLLGTIRLLLTFGANITAKDGQGDTFLIQAIYWNWYELCKFFASYKELINEPNSTLESPLHCAILSTKFDLKKIKLLIHFGANIDSVNNDFDSPLYYAIFNKKFNLRAMQLLVNSGANTNLKNANGDSPLWCLIDKKTLDPETRYKAAKFLIEKGANVNWVNEDGYSILMNVILKRKIDSMFQYKIIKLLIKKNADINFVNQNHNSALLNAVSLNKPQIVALLIRHGADIYHANAKKNTALDIAKKKNFEEIIQLLTAAKKRGNQRK